MRSFDREVGPTMVPWCLGLVPARLAQRGSFRNCTILGGVGRTALAIRTLDRDLGALPAARSVPECNPVRRKLR